MMTLRPLKPRQIGRLLFKHFFRSRRPFDPRARVWQIAYMINWHAYCLPNNPIAIMVICYPLYAPIGIMGIC